MMISVDNLVNSTEFWHDFNQVSMFLSPITKYEIFKRIHNRPSKNQQILFSAWLLTKNALNS